MCLEMFLKHLKTHQNMLFLLLFLLGRCSSKSLMLIVSDWIGMKFGRMVFDQDHDVISCRKVLPSVECTCICRSSI